MPTLNPHDDVNDEKLKNYPVYKFGLKPDTELSEEDEPAILACTQWIINNLTPAKNWKTDYTSYQYKHRVEEEVKLYIPQGAFIEAAKRLHVEFKPAPHSALSAVFKLKKKKLEEPWKEK